MTEKRSPLEVMKGFVRERREIEGIAKEEKISTKHFKSGENFEYVKSLLEKRIEALVSKNSWLGRKLENVSKKFISLDEEEIVGEFKRGAVLCLKQEYLVVKKVQGEDNPEFDIRDINRIIHAYAFEFIRSMIKSSRQNIPPKTALDIAVLSYQHDLNLFKDLKEGFPEFNNTVLFKAITSHPANPEEFLNEVRNELEIIQKEYPEFEPSLVKHVVVTYSKDKRRIFLEKAYELSRGCL